jgi:hypothetical protein
VTPAAKVTYLGALLIGLSLGLLLGYKQTSDLLKLRSEGRLVTAPFALEDFSREQYVHADPEHAKAALLTYAGVLESMEKARAAKMQKFELSFTFTRLALLEDTGNNPQQSQSYMTKARYWNSAAGGHDYSESEMKAALMRADGQR